MVELLSRIGDLVHMTVRFDANRSSNAAKAEIRRLKKALRWKIIAAQRLQDLERHSGVGVDARIAPEASGDYHDQRLQGRPLEDTSSRLLTTELNAPTPDAEDADHSVPSARVLPELRVKGRSCDNKVRVAVVQHQQPRR